MIGTLSSGSVAAAASSRTSSSSAKLLTSPVIWPLVSGALVSQPDLSNHPSRSTHAAAGNSCGSTASLIGSGSASGQGWPRTLYWDGVCSGDGDTLSGPRSPLSLDLEFCTASSSASCTTPQYRSAPSLVQDQATGDCQ